MWKVTEGDVDQRGDGWMESKTVWLEKSKPLKKREYA